jgi:DNA invertase Pin-like site-specific DNA recombinase
VPRMKGARMERLMTSKPQARTVSGLQRFPANQDLQSPEVLHRVGYARVSTADQDLRLQIDALVRDGVAEEDIFQEKISAVKVGRPQFTAMMRDLRAGDLLVVWKLDRLGRSVRQVLDTFADLDRRGIKVRVITQLGMDTTTPMGRMIVTVMAAVAELERDMIRERTAAGLAAARERGRVGGRRETYSDAQIEAAAALVRQGASIAEARMDVKDRKGRPITATRLRSRIQELENRT